jgi:hypothetical protein
MAALGQPDEDAIEGARYGGLPGGQTVERVPPLFPKIDA